MSTDKSTTRRAAGIRIHEAIMELNAAVADGARVGVYVSRPTLMDVTNVGEPQSFVLVCDAVMIDLKETTE